MQANSRSGILPRKGLMMVSGQDDRLPGESATQPSVAPAATGSPPPRNGQSIRDYAAQLLIAPAALMQLSLVEAKIVVSYMQPERVPAGETFITEGDTINTGFMVLLLEGEVLIENITVSRTKPVTVTVLGPGSLIGEMGVLDTGPRSASCTASTDIACAVLTREALETLIAEQPVLGAKFLLAVSARIAERYRETQKKLVLFARLAATMQQELDRKI
jgi:CRP/FNR family transcriptional regulator, cyclic AMP receptor protein